MAFTQIDNSIVDDPNLSPNELVVYIHLKRLANRENQCFPSISTLAEHTKLCKTTVKQCINGLIEKKLISKSKRESKYIKNLTNLYTVSAPEKDNKADQPIQIARQYTKSRSKPSFDVNDLERLAMLKYQKKDEQENAG